MNGLRIYIVGMLSATLLIGCMSGVRPYDGVVGFTVLPQSIDHYRYIDEQRKGQKFVLTQLRRGCAERLKVPLEQVQLEQIEVNPRTGQISQSLQIPTGVAFSGANVQTDRQTVYGQDNQTQPIALIEATARCTTRRPAVTTAP